MYLPFYFYTLIRSSDFLDSHIQIHVYFILLISYLERITGILRSRSSLT